jgi:hypothetical protein
MLDPKLIDPSKPRIPDEWRRIYMQRPIEKLPADVVYLFDEQHKLKTNLQKDKTQIDKSLLDAQSKLRWARGLISLLLVAMAGSWAVTVLVVKLWLIPILQRVPR